MQAEQPCQNFSYILNIELQLLMDSPGFTGFMLIFPITMICPLCISQHCHDNQNLGQVMTKTKAGRAGVKNRTRPAGPTLHDTIQIKCETCKAEALLKMIAKIHVTNTENKQRFLPLICFNANPVLYVYTKTTVSDQLNSRYLTILFDDFTIYVTSFCWLLLHLETTSNHRMYTLILLQLSHDQTWDKITIPHDN